MIIVKFFKFLVKLAIYAFFGFIALIIVVSVFVKSEKTDNQYDTEEYSDFVTFDDSTGSEANGEGVKHVKTWTDFDNDTYSEEFSMLSANYNRSRSERENINTDWDFTSPFMKYCEKNKALWDMYPEAIYWTYIYNSLSNNDSEQLDSIYAMLNRIKLEEKPNKRKFAEIAITFVQDIPYAFVHELSCEVDIANRKADGSYTFEEYHFKNCVPDARFGLLSPVEFCYTLKGDCDTRSVLLFTILTHYGYDAAVLYSREYAHAILGVNIPEGNDYLEFENKKYYVVETTAENWQIGNIPPENSNLNYWNVILTSDIVKRNRKI